MKAILKPVSPKLCEKVISGECTLLLSKTRPKLEPPFKEYIYCTKGNREALWYWKGEWYYDIRFPEERPNRANGKVIGEFVCDRIIVDERGENADIFSKCALLSLDEQKEYCANKTLYGLHISELKIYDKPKELGEFSSALSLKDIRCKHIEKRYKTYNGKPYIKCTLQNCVCEFRRLGTQTDCDGYEMLKEPARLTKAPRSWCYVEELEEL